MFTYQMVGVADQNDKKYECKYGTYTHKDGFVFNESIGELVETIGWRGIVNMLFHENLWKLSVEEPKPIKPKEMTLEDIEKELGYRVQIVDPEPDKEEVSQDKKEEVNELVDLFNRLFGIDFRDED